MATATETTTQTELIPEVGIHRGVPFEEYLAWEAVSNSRLRPGLQSMAHLKAAMDSPPREPTPSLTKGTLCHAAILETFDFMKRYIVMPDYATELRDTYKSPKHSNAYKDKVTEFERVNEGRQIVDADEFAMIQGVARSLRNHDRTRELFGLKGESEVSIVWHDRDTGLLCKGRLDWWVPDRLFVDLKTSRDVHRFEREIAKHNYDMQMALYFDGLFAVTGYGHCKHIAAVETTAPFGVRAATVSADVIESGRSKYKRLLRQYKQCQQDDDWPGYTDPEQWVMPDWGYDSDNVQLTMNGKKI